MANRDQAWPENPSIVFAAARLGEIVPNQSMGYGARFNALTRLAFVLAIVAVLLGYSWLAVGVVLLTTLAALYYADQRQHAWAQEVLMGSSDQSVWGRQVGGGGVTCQETALGLVQCDGRDGCWREGEREQHPVPGLPTLPLVPGQGGDRCRLPTADNPFMNAIPGASAVAQVTPACQPRAMEPLISAVTGERFGQSPWADSNDLWQKRQNERQFYTNPGTTLVNDRENFMKWCWDTPFACKDGDGDACFIQGY